MSIIYIKEVYSDDLSIILRVDGILDSTSISILKTACERHTNGKQKIELDLRKLIHINREGREFLEEDSTGRHSRRISSIHRIGRKGLGKMEMKRANLIISMALELFGVLIIIECFKLEIKTLNDPGAGFFPVILAVTMCLLGLPILIGALKKSEVDAGEKTQEPGNVPFGKIAVVMAALAGYAVFLNILGSLLTFFFFMFALFWMGNPRRWLFVSGISALVAALSYLLFVILLQVPFPPGIWR